MNPVGTTCSIESSSSRLKFKAWRCFGVGPVLRVLLNSWTRSLDVPSRGTECFEGLQRGKSRGVAGGGGSRGSLLSSLRAARVEYVSDSPISYMSFMRINVNIATSLMPGTVESGNSLEDKKKNKATYLGTTLW